MKFGWMVTRSWVKFKFLILPLVKHSVLLWLAGGLTLITGYDYFRKSVPYLKEDA